MVTISIMAMTRKMTEIPFELYYNKGITPGFLLPQNYKPLNSLKRFLRSSYPSCHSRENRESITSKHLDTHFRGS